MNFCDKCNKIVTDKEVQTILGNKFHIYTKIVNAYKNQRPETIGYCEEEKTVFCGKIREPSAEEYFIYNTLDS